MKNFDELDLDVIIFNMNSRLLAVQIDYLVEILQEVPVSPLPFVPAYVEGLVNINSKIMPQVNLAKLLFDEDLNSTSNSKTLLIIDVDDIQVALKIDAVKESYTIQAAQLTLVQKTEKLSNKKQSKKTATNNSHCKGTFEVAGEIVTLFDASSLRHIVKSTAKPVGKQGFLGKVVQEKIHQDIFHDYLIAEVDGKEFAIALDEVNEIVLMDEITSLPRSPNLVAGIAMVRGFPKLLVRFSELTGEGGTGKSKASGAAIMIRVGTAQCGVLADKMVGLETIRDNQLRQNVDKTQFTILREDGKTLTRVIRLVSFFDDMIMSLLKPYWPSLKNNVEDIRVKEIEMLRFQLGPDAYAFRLDQIRRVVSGKHIEPLLSQHAFLMGTMELEGRVVPVINLIQQLGYQQSETPVFEYIVVTEGARHWALAIGESDQIIKVPEPHIDPVDSSEAKFVAAYCNYNERLLTILNLKAICSENLQHEAV